LSAVAACRPQSLAHGTADERDRDAFAGGRAA
jgi:hypothetical protein